MSVTSFIDDFLGQKNTLFLSVAVLLFVILRFPSVTEPYWYGDEGIYEVIGAAIANGRVLYSEIWDNKPPLLYLIYALFAGDQFWVRVLSLVSGALSVVVFFALARKIFKSSAAIFVSTIFFAFMFGSPVIEGNIANAENFIILPILGAFYLCFAAKKTAINLATAGVIFSFAFLIKIVAVFDFLAALSIILFTQFHASTTNLKNVKKEIWNFVKEEKIIIISFIIPIVITFLYFVAVGALPDFLSAAFSQNIGYVAYENFFIINNGLLVIKFIVLFISLFLIFGFRKKLSTGAIIVLIWLVFEFFSIMFSARPYTHYLLAMLPAFSILLGLIIEDKKLRLVTISLLIVVLLILNNNFKVHKKILPYYSNYLSFIFNGDVDAYRKSFDSNTPRDYELVRFINLKTDKNDNVFLWSDSAQIYALSGKLPPGRFAVAYHIISNPGAIEETKMAIDKKQPKYIIQTKDDPAILNFLDGYELRYIIDKSKIYERQP